MIKANLDKSAGILHVKPSGPMDEADFETLAGLADPYVAKKGALAELMLEIDKFPGWKNFAAMLKHFRFVRSHHREIRRVALITDARIGAIAPKLARHIVAAEVKRFPAGHAEEARKWIAEG